MKTAKNVIPPRQWKPNQIAHQNLLQRPGRMVRSAEAFPDAQIVAELSRAGRHGCRSRPPSLPALGSGFTKTWRNHESRIAPQAVAFGHTLRLAIRRRPNCAETSERHS